ncbi:MAG: glycosyltransferase family 2 protein, partial [Bacteroidota bacterium]
MKGSKKNRNNYIIISPVRNEEEYIEKTICSVINQTIKPLEWIIVNDGSTDKTPTIIQKYSKDHNWIKTINREKGQHEPGTGVVKAFYNGLEHVTRKNYDYLVKLDGDLSFEPDYFETLLERFASDPALGIASGKTYIPGKKGFILDPCPNNHVRGPAKMYRETCFNDIGGIPVVLGWDTIDENKAQMKGWKTKSFDDLKIMHYKPIGYKQKNTIKKELIAGERQYFLGYHPIFALAKGVAKTTKKPYIIGGMLNITGYMIAALKKS